MENAAPACLFPIKSLEYPLSRSKEGHGEPDHGPRGRFGAFGPVSPCQGGERVPTRCGEKSREPARGAGRRTNPRCRVGSGDHSPSSSQPEPAEPRSGAIIPAARPLRPAPRTAARTAHPTGALRLDPHAPRANPAEGGVLAALLLSPSCRALQIPPKRGYAADGARMLVRASLPFESMSGGG